MSNKQDIYFAQIESEDTTFYVRFYSKSKSDANDEAMDYAQYNCDSEDYKIKVELWDESIHGVYREDYYFTDRTDYIYADLV